MKTTREAAKEATHKERANSLQELLEKNYDAEKGYRKAIEDADSPNLKRFFKEQAVMRNHFATEIDKAMHAINVRPKDSGSTVGDLHRAWMDFKAMFTKNDDESMLEECIRGEKASIKEYENKLKNTKFSPDTENMLRAQLEKIRDTVQTIKRMEDLAD
ncbi:ferritin-like domain-containing protein [Salegentibacter sp. HM20]